MFLKAAAVMQNMFFSLLHAALYGMHTPLPVNLGFLSRASDCNSKHAILRDPFETSPGQRVCWEAKSHVQGAVLSKVHTAPHAQVYTCTHTRSLNTMVMTLVSRAVTGA